MRQRVVIKPKHRNRPPHKGPGIQCPNVPQSSLVETIENSPAIHCRSKCQKNVTSPVRTTEKAASKSNGILIISASLKLKGHIDFQKIHFAALGNSKKIIYHDSLILIHMDTQDGQDINLYHVYPVHPCVLKKISIWDIISCELPYRSGMAETMLVPRQPPPLQKLPPSDCCPFQ